MKDAEGTHLFPEFRGDSVARTASPSIQKRRSLFSYSRKEDDSTFVFT